MENVQGPFCGHGGGSPADGARRRFLETIRVHGQPCFQARPGSGKHGKGRDLRSDSDRRWAGSARLRRDLEAPGLDPSPFTASTPMPWSRRRSSPAGS